MVTRRARRGHPHRLLRVLWWRTSQRLRRRGRPLLAALLVAGLWVAVRSWSGWSVGEVAARVPGTVFGGGGPCLTVEVEMSHAGTLCLFFSQETGRSLAVERSLAAGRHSFTVALPPERACCDVQALVRRPPPGARVALEVASEGRPIHREERFYEAAEARLFVGCALDSVDAAPRLVAAW